MVEADEQPPAGEKYYAQALTNRVSVYVGDQKIRSKASAEYFIEWVNRLRKEMSDGKLWRTEAERSRAFAQLDEALAVYRARAAEAVQ